MHPDDAKAGGNNLKLGWQLLGHFGHIEPKLPTVKARDGIAEGYEAGLRRQSPQMGTIVKGIVDGDKRVMLPTLRASDGYERRNRKTMLRIMAEGGDVTLVTWAAVDGAKITESVTGGLEESPLLPTPNTMEHREIKTPEQIAELKKRSPGGYRNLRETVVNDLFPTPMAQEGIKAPSQQTSEVKGKNGQVWLSNVAKDLEPKIGTPRTSSANGSTSKQVANGASKSRIEDQVLLTDWGKFAPAIERWEVAIDREAPAPTKPDGKDGQHRLSAEFTEWMMGLPAGWVTDPELGLTRNEQLKLCGNGVVPQQAALALTRLLTGVNIDSAPRNGGGSLMFPTPTVSDIYTDNLASTQQKPGSMHSVTLAQAAKWVNTEEQK